MFSVLAYSKWVPKILAWQAVLALINISCPCKGYNHMLSLKHPFCFRLQKENLWCSTKHLFITYFKMRFGLHINNARNLSVEYLIKHREYITRLYLDWYKTCIANVVRFHSEVENPKTSQSAWKEAACQEVSSLSGKNGRFSLCVHPNILPGCDDVVTWNPGWEDADKWWNGKRLERRKIKLSAEFEEWVNKRYFKYLSLRPGYWFHLVNHKPSRVREELYLIPFGES